MRGARAWLPGVMAVLAAAAGCETVVDLGRMEGEGASFICLHEETCAGTAVTGAAACTDTSSCDFHLSGAAQATCTAQASCTFQVGGGSVITCASSARCDVRCEGPCWVQCAGPCTCTGEGCSLACGLESPHACAGGGTGCGSGC